MILSMDTEDTLNTVHRQEGQLKAHVLLAAPRQPGHRAEPVTLPTQSAQQSETLLSARPTCLLEESAAASSWDDGKHTRGADSCNQH